MRQEQTLNQLNPLIMVDWNPYLDSLCNAYTQWWTFGTLKDVVEPKRVESEPSTLPFEFGLMVQTVERDAQQRSKEEQKVERLGVLEGLQKYASEHVLLVGRPGGGKSTALVRLLVATAQQALQNPHSQIPVLVELRTYKIYYKTSVLDLVQASLKRRKLRRLDIETIEDLLAQGRFLLLMDGINELPDDEARRNIKEFRLDYSDVPMVFTTRDLGVGGDLGIEKKLEMQSLTEAEVEKFVRECMPGGSEERLQQLRQRLRELGQTPFVMWMLYFIVQKTGTVPSGAGSAFREFTQLYERRSKEDAPVSDESRRCWSRLLERLGFEMIQADKPTDLRLTISKREAEEILTQVVDSEKFDKPRDRALQWLEDLLKHHLIQVTTNDQIEFCHQLIQEYYAAERLLKMLTSPPRRTSPPTPLLQREGSKIPVPPFPSREAGALVRRLGGLGLSDDELKREYLNYLKWTEPLALMLELVEDEAQAVRVVRLALEVDLRLGARLAGAVKPAWQEQTVGFVTELDVPQLLKIELLGVTRSALGIPFLLSALNNEDFDVRYSASNALGNIGSEAVVSALLPLLEDRNSSVRIAAVSALEEIATETVFEALLSALKHEYSDVRQSAASALGKIGSEIALASLVEALNDEESSVRREAASALGKIASEMAVPALLKALNDEGHWVSESAAYALGEIGSEKAVPALLKALRSDKSTFVKAATTALGQIGSQATIPALLEVVKDENILVRANAAYALGELRDKVAVPSLLEALKDENVLVRAYAASALGELRDKATVLALLETLKDKDAWVRGNAASALGKIGSEEVVPMLLEALHDEDEDSLVRANAAYALGQLGTKAAVTALLLAVRSQNYRVRKNSVLALGQIGTETAVESLLSALTDEDSWVRAYAAEALGKIGTEEAFAGLMLALKDTIPSVRRGAIKGLEKIGTEKAVTELLPVLKDADFYVRQDAGYVLRRVASFEILPYLNQLLQTTGERHLLDAITAIQERCKFYNYTLTQPPQMEDKSKSEVKRDQVFISYSHKDKKYLEKLQTMLKPMMRNDTILVWDDTKIQAGAKWRDEIEKALARANVAVLMVSANFLASDFIAKHELPPLLNAAEQEGLKIIWVPVGYCLYEETEIEQYQAVHNPSQPLESLKGAKLNQVLVKICQEIKAASIATAQ